MGRAGVGGTGRVRRTAVTDPRRLGAAIPDIRLTAETVEYEDTGGEGPVVVLLHGLVPPHARLRSRGRCPHRHRLAQGDRRPAHRPPRDRPDPALRRPPPPPVPAAHAGPGQRADRGVPRAPRPHRRHPGRERLRTRPDGGHPASGAARAAGPDRVRGVRHLPAGAAREADRRRLPGARGRVPAGPRARAEAAAPAPRRHRRAPQAAGAGGGRRRLAAPAAGAWPNCFLRGGWWRSRTPGH